MTRRSAGRTRTRRRLSAAGVVVLLGAGLGASVAVAGSGDDRAERVSALRHREWNITAVRLDGELRFDGRLDEAAWSAAPPVTEFYQNENNEGLPGSERTEIRVLYDAQNLYVGVRCLDSRPENVKALSLFRDENSGDDLILIAIDAFHDHRSAAHFITNPNGYMVDSLQTGETTATRNQNWDTVWDARGTRTASGWEAELTIPFKSLRFARPAAGEPLIFGIGFKRNLPRKNEEESWPFVPNSSSWYRPAELGHLVGLEGVRPGRSLDLHPYALAGYRSDVAAGVRGGRREAGLDVKWGVTPSLTADFTVNTDFAQEEADVQQTNFTRFSLSLPEKRQFFLENQRMFQFGLPGEVDLLFTRRIGLSDDGRVIPILAGARLSGRQGRTAIGAMTLQTGDEDGLPGGTFSVVRVRRDILRRSSVGALVTSRDEGRANRVLGADASLLFGDGWSFDGFYARQTDDRDPDTQHAAYSRLAYQTDRIGAAYRFLDVDEQFRPGIGFVRRRDSREQYGELRYSPRPDIPWLRQVHATSTFRYITGQDGRLETQETGGRVEAALETGDLVAAAYLDRVEVLDEPFALRRDVAVTPGSYRFRTVTATVNTFRRRKARINLTAAHGGFWGGIRDTFIADGYYRMTKHFGASLRYEVNEFDLPGVRFVSQLASSRIEIAFNKDTVLLPLLQYNPDTRQLSSNIRFNWIPKPGTDFFIVYTELDELRRPLIMKNRSLAVKLNYLFAL